MSLQMELSAIYFGWLFQWCLSIILCLMLLVSTIYHFHKIGNSSDNAVYLSVKVVSLSYFASYIIAFALIVTELCLKIDSNEDGSTDSIEDIVWGIGMLIGGFAELMFYLLLLMRLHSTFKDTVYSSSKYLYYAYIIGVILYALCGICYIGGVTTNIDEVLRVIFIVIFATINLLIRFSLIALFIYKLCQLVAETSVVASIYSERPCVDLLQTITKQLLLGSFAIICNTVALAVVGIERFTRDEDKLGQKYGTFMYIGVALLGISVWIEMSCAYLGFSFNNKPYYAVCGKCHEKCCYPITQKEIRRMSVRRQSNHKKQGAASVIEAQ